MTTMTNDLTLEVSHFAPFPPERVFDAWLDPEMLTKFMRPSPTMDAPTVTNDPRVGGKFRIVMNAPDQPEGWPHDGEYLIIDRPNRLKFTWISAYTQDDSTVTIDFTPQDDGTLVRLTHVRFPNEESRANHEGGWARILSTLAAELS